MRSYPDPTMDPSPIRFRALRLCSLLLLSLDISLSFSPIRPNAARQRRHLISTALVPIKDDRAADVGGNPDEEARRGFLAQVTSAAATAATSTLLPQSAAAATGTPAAVSASTKIARPAYPADMDWPLGKVAFSLIPLAGTSTRRATVMEEVVPGQIWTMD